VTPLPPVSDLFFMRRERFGAAGIGRDGKGNQE